MPISCSILWQQTHRVSIALGTALGEGYFTENYPSSTENHPFDVAPVRAATRPTDTNCNIYSADAHKALTLPSLAFCSYSFHLSLSFSFIPKAVKHVLVLWCIQSEFWPWQARGSGPMIINIALSVLFWGYSRSFEMGMVIVVKSERGREGEIGPVGMWTLIMISDPVVKAWSLDVSQSSDTPKDIDVTAWIQLKPGIHT